MSAHLEVVPREAPRPSLRFRESRCGPTGYTRLISYEQTPFRGTVGANDREGHRPGPEDVGAAPHQERALPTQDALWEMQPVKVRRSQANGGWDGPARARRNVVSSSRVVVSVNGRFDIAEAAALLGRYLLDLSDLTVDFSHAQHVDESALALLQQASVRRGVRHLAMVGLNRHLERLLRYLASRPPDARD